MLLTYMNIKCCNRLRSLQGVVSQEVRFLTLIIDTGVFIKDGDHATQANAPSAAFVAIFLCKHVHWVKHFIKSTQMDGNEMDVETLLFALENACV